MSDGWIKLHRKCLDNGMMHNPKLFTFWMYCLLKASHKDRKYMMGFKEISLKKGQFIFGRKQAAKKLKMSEQSIRTCLYYLKKHENLTIKSTNKFSIISIVNWDSYQQLENQINQQTNQQVTSKQPASNHRQEGKERKESIYTPNFSAFWIAYPKKVGKGAAFKSYNNILQPRPSLQTILDSVESHKKTKQWQDKQFIPQPATFLNQRRWEDEIDIPTNLYKLKTDEEIAEEKRVALL